MPRDKLERIEQGLFYSRAKKLYIARVRRGRDFEKFFSRKSDARNWRNSLIADFQIAPPEVLYSVQKGWHFYIENEGETVFQQFGELNEAIRAYHDLKHAVRTGGYLSEEKRAIKFGDFAKEWLEGKVNLEVSTSLRYDCELRNNVLPYLSNVPVHQLNADRTQHFIRSLISDGKSPATVDKAVKLVLQIMKEAKQQRIGKAIDLDELTLPKLVRKKSKAFSFDFINELATRCGKYESLVRLYVALGLRAEEMAALKVHHVRFDIGALTVEESFKVARGYKRVLGTTKSSQVRLLPLTSAALDMFANITAGKGADDFIWTGARGGPLNLGWFRREFLRPALLEMGESEQSLHAMRATFSSHLFSKKHSPAVITKLVGHSKLDTTLNYYTHVLNDDDLEAMKEFDSILMTSTGQERGDVVSPTNPVTAIQPETAPRPRRRRGRSLVASRRIELPTHGLGNRCSIH